MNRRDFVRVVTGVAVSAPTWCRATGIPLLPPTPGILQVYLDGPFAVVLKKDGSGNVLAANAYVPIEDQGKREHQFHFKGKQDEKKNYKFKLPKDGLSLDSIVTPNVEFDAFTGKAVSGSPTCDSFVQVELPPGAPKEIKFLSKTTADVKGIAGKVTMPLDHVLVYAVSDISKVTMTCDQLGPSRPEKFDTNAYQFHLEVGLPMNSDPDGSKAVNFFNKQLLTAFPNSQIKAKELVHIDQPLTETSDVECKNGGLLLTQP